MREGWPQVFLHRPQKAPEKTTTQLKELFKNVTGAGESVAEKMASTFKALADRADWSGEAIPHHAHPGVIVLAAGMRRDCHAT